MNIESIVRELRAYEDEQEWFEFKENWFEPETLGEYVSAMSNAVAFESTETVQNVFFKTLGDVLRINLASGGGNGDEGQYLDELFEEEE